MATDPTSLDVTDATFEQEVVERSRRTPVVVDLWAPWCTPCRQLGPLLEEAVAATAGAVVLAKVNVDENPAVSQLFRAQSIPAVYAMRDAKVVNGFVGARGRAEVEQFIASLAPTEEESELARLVAAGDEGSLRKALELDPAHAGAIVALAELAVADDRSDEALDLLARIPETAETRRVAALARTGPVAADDDVEARLTGLLDRVKEDDDARRQFLDLLELLGPDDPRTGTFRRKLAARLY